MAEAAEERAVRAACSTCGAKAKLNPRALEREVTCPKCGLRGRFLRLSEFGGTNAPPSERAASPGERTAPDCERPPWWRPSGELLRDRWKPLAALLGGALAAMFAAAFLAPWILLLPATAALLPVAGVLFWHKRLELQTVVYVLIAGATLSGISGFLFVFGVVRAHGLQQEAAARAAQRQRKAELAAAREAAREDLRTAKRIRRKEPDRAVALLTRCRKHLTEGDAQEANRILASVRDEFRRAEAPEKMRRAARLAEENPAQARAIYDLYAPYLNDLELKEDVRRAIDAAVAAQEVRDEQRKKLLALLGPKPENSAWDGSVPCVVEHLKNTLHDYDSSKDYTWYEPTLVRSHETGVPFWCVRVRFRAKNLMGAYILGDKAALIQKGKVVAFDDLSEVPKHFDVVE